MNKSILKTVVVSAVAVMFSVGCSEKPEDEGGNTGGKGNDISNYRTVTIGTQTWMAENLDYAIEGSKCFGEGGVVIIRYDENGPVTITLSNAEVRANCVKYGRLYTWEAAKSVCPSGWHLPSDAEWTTLTDYVGSNPGTKLKSSTDWYDYSDNGVPAGTDEYRFSALPSGGGGGNGYFAEAGGERGHWWSATAVDADNALFRHMDFYDENVYRGDDDKKYLKSIRCVQN
jgi:uncharacterized protein (TIGR02145 family)